ncbi:hypothetical protein J7E63_15950 [Bacillus sp. ISL-75]|uniref:hypothetical protein n=1 Tax=Bacillus sp. ISL-75 TaxID=2819137 RepID=UPI001BE806F6|nr:hypothetical protein [Bacillus sp. ISL-75]MBT2728422.1 hypothetical protein [Bacillus sp. ISL-75]
MINFLFELLGLALDGGSTGLDTRKIDRNIERLKQQGWFKKIFEDEKYHRLFFTNRHIRAYLQSNFRVNKIINNEKAQKKLLNLLDEQLLK